MSDEERNSEEPQFHRLSADCWEVLSAIRRGGWEASALDLNQQSLWSHRQRISDLRRYFLVEIEADSHVDKATQRLHTIYRIPEHARARAEWLWRRGSLAGYAANARQRGMFR